MENLREILELHYHKRNTTEDFSTPDPLVVLKEYKGDEDFEYIALFCALFSYGNAEQIVRFLKKIDFSLLREREGVILQSHLPYYRFQTSSDVRGFLHTLQKIKIGVGLKNIALQAYKKQGILGVIDGIIGSLYKNFEGNVTKGIKHLFGKINPLQEKNPSALKRYNLFLRWLVRRDNIDFGYWKEIDSKDLIIPLDTHIFKIATRLGLLERKTCDFKSAELITKALRCFDSTDPVKYDFALYRIGQEKIVI
ncbi:TIGR02757 family protein [Helicobacter anatolicus]|uniref:TIGR02757 family protein n=1 Tax=Helicobacter anatolicus TaxID=2905874 RepID=UPI001E49ED70|nr:TIGR02757 family protein [Helicobacter anatolicus]